MVASGSAGLVVQTLGAHKRKVLHISREPNSLIILSSSLSSSASIVVGDPITFTILATVDGIPTPNVAISAVIIRVGNRGINSTRDMQDETVTSSGAIHGALPNSETICSLAGYACGRLDGQAVDITDETGRATLSFTIVAGSQGLFKLRFSASQSDASVFLTVARRGRKRIMQLRGIGVGNSYFQEKYNYLYESLSSGDTDTYTPVLDPVFAKLYTSTITSAFPLINTARKIIWNHKPENMKEEDNEVELKAEVDAKFTVDKFSLKVLGCCGNPIPGVTVRVVVLENNQPCTSCVNIQNIENKTGDDGIVTFSNVVILKDNSKKSDTYKFAFDAQGTISNSKINACPVASKETCDYVGPEDNQEDYFDIVNENLDDEGAMIAFKLLSEGVQEALESKLKVAAFLGVGIGIPVMFSNVPYSHWIFLALSVSLVSGGFAYLVYSELQTDQEVYLRIFRICIIALVIVLFVFLLKGTNKYFSRESKKDSEARNRVRRAHAYLRWLINWRPRRAQLLNRFDQMYLKNDSILTSYGWKIQHFLNEHVFIIIKIVSRGKLRFELEIIQPHRLDQVGKFTNQAPSVEMPEPPAHVDPRYVPLKFVIAVGVSLVSFAAVVIVCIILSRWVSVKIDLAILNLPAPPSLDDENALMSELSQKAQQVNTIVIDLMTAISANNENLTFLATWAHSLKYWNVFDALMLLSKFVSYLRGAHVYAQASAHAAAALIFILNVYFLREAILKYKLASRRGELHHTVRASSISASNKYIGSHVVGAVLQQLVVYFYVFFIVLLLSVPFVLHFVWLVFRPFVIAFAIGRGQEMALEILISSTIVRELVILRPFLNSAFAIYTTVMGVVEGFGQSFFRFLWGIHYPIFCFARIDWGIVAGPWNRAIDSFHHSFIGMIAADSAYNDPVMLCFASELLLTAKLMQINRNDIFLRIQQQADFAKDMKAVRIGEAGGGNDSSPGASLSPLRLNASISIQRGISMGSFLARQGEERAVVGGLVNLDVLEMAISLPSIRQLMQIRLLELRNERIPFIAAVIDQAVENAKIEFERQHQQSTDHDDNDDFLVKQPKDQKHATAANINASLGKRSAPPSASELGEFVMGPAGYLLGEGIVMYFNMGRDKTQFDDGSSPRELDVTPSHKTIENFKSGNLMRMNLTHIDNALPYEGDTLHSLAVNHNGSFANNNTSHNLSQGSLIASLRGFSSHGNFNGGGNSKFGLESSTGGRVHYAINSNNSNNNNTNPKKRRSSYKTSNGRPPPFSQDEHASSHDKNNNTNQNDNDDDDNNINNEFGEEMKCQTVFTSGSKINAEFIPWSKKPFDNDLQLWTRRAAFTSDEQLVLPSPAVLEELHRKPKNGKDAHKLMSMSKETETLLASTRRFEDADFAGDLKENAFKDWCRLITQKFFFTLPSFRDSILRTRFDQDEINKSRDNQQPIHEKMAARDFIFCPEEDDADDSTDFRKIDALVDDDPVTIGGPRFRRVLRRWRLWVLLAKNPSLRQYRKQRLPLPGFPLGDAPSSPVGVPRNWRSSAPADDANTENEALEALDELGEKLLESPWVDDEAKDFDGLQQTKWTVTCLATLRMNRALRFYGTRSAPSLVVSAQHHDHDHGKLHASHEHNHHHPQGHKEEKANSKMAPLITVTSSDYYNTIENRALYQHFDNDKNIIKNEKDKHSEVLPQSNNNNNNNNAEEHEDKVGRDAGDV